MSNILVIDDVREFRFEATYARTVEEAEVLLFSQPWDEVWWDHDMGWDANFKFVITVPLARKLEVLAHEGTLLPIGKTYIHTASWTGARERAAALRDYSPTVVDAYSYTRPDSVM